MAFVGSHAVDGIVEGRRRDIPLAVALPYRLPFFLSSSEGIPGSAGFRGLPNSCAVDVLEENDAVTWEAAYELNEILSADYLVRRGRWCKCSVRRRLLWQRRGVFACCGWAMEEVPAVVRDSTARVPFRSQFGAFRLGYLDIKEKMAQELRGQSCALLLPPNQCGPHARLLSHRDPRDWNKYLSGLYSVSLHL